MLEVCTKYFDQNPNTDKETFLTEFEEKIELAFGEGSVQKIFSVDHPADLSVGQFVVDLMLLLKEYRENKLKEFCKDAEKKFGKKYINRISKQSLK